MKRSTTPSTRRRWNAIYTGQIVGTQQILPPGMPGYEKFELFPHNVKKAKELIAESGIKDKEVTVWTDSESPNNDAGTYYAGVLNEIGLKAELKILNPDNYFTVIGNTVDPEPGHRVRRLVRGLSRTRTISSTSCSTAKASSPTNNENFSQSNNEDTERKDQQTLRRTARP